MFFGQWCRTIEVINVKKMNTPPPKKNITENKKKQKEQVRQQGRITHLQRRRYMKRNTSIRTSHGKHHHQKICLETKKKFMFSLFFGHPERVALVLRIIFRRRTKPKPKKKKKWAKNRERENRKTLFSLFDVFNHVLLDRLLTLPRPPN